MRRATKRYTNPRLLAYSYLQVPNSFLCRQYHTASASSIPPSPRVLCPESCALTGNHLSPAQHTNPGLLSPEGSVQNSQPSVGTISPSPGLCPEHSSQPARREDLTSQTSIQYAMIRLAWVAVRTNLALSNFNEACASTTHERHIFKYYQWSAGEPSFCPRN